MCREDSSGPCEGTCNERSVCRITLGRVDVQIVLETEERPVPADQSAEIVPVAWLPMCGQNIHLTRKGCRNVLRRHFEAMPKQCYRKCLIKMEGLTVYRT